MTMVSVLFPRGLPAGGSAGVVRISCSNSSAGTGGLQWKPWYWSQPHPRRKDRLRQACENLARHGFRVPGPGDLIEHQYELVAGDMPERVVDGLEAIQIQDQYGEATSATLALCRGQRQAVREKYTVG
jgi:hypothetical protein